MTAPTKLTIDEFRGLVDIVSKPTFKFMMKRIEKETLNIINKRKEIHSDDFCKILMAIASTLTINLFTWMEVFNRENGGREIGLDTAISILINALKEEVKAMGK